MIKYKGTDAAGIFRMGVTKVPDDAAVQAWQVERANWRELTVTVVSE
jgi:hypothetical protein